MRIYFLFLFLGYSILGYGIQASLDIISYKQGKQSYVDQYIRIFQESINFKESNGLYSGAVDIYYYYKDENGVIANYDKFRLALSDLPEKQDLLNVKSIALPSGSYSITIEIVDVNDETNKSTISQLIEVVGFKMTVLSDLLLCLKVSNDELGMGVKNGLIIEPLPNGVSPEEQKVLQAYLEYYPKSILFPGATFIEFGVSSSSDLMAGVLFKKYKKLGDKKENPMLLNIPVDELFSGSYIFYVHLMDYNRKILETKTVPFTKNNFTYDKEYWYNYQEVENNTFLDDLTEDELVYALKAIAPNVFEPKLSLLNYIIREAPVRAKRSYLHKYWKDNGGDLPKQSYEQYMKVADYVDQEYNSNVGFGFETDRGYIFLRYGKPNHILSIDQEPDAPPYEIWYYDQIPISGERRVRFLFYNPSLATNDYQLLHSSTRLELQNPAWELELYDSVPQDQIGSRVDATEVRDNWNRNARRYFNEF